VVTVNIRRCVFLLSSVCHSRRPCTDVTMNCMASVNDYFQIETAKLEVNGNSKRKTDRRTQFLFNWRTCRTSPLTESVAAPPVVRSTHCAHDHTRVSRLLSVDRRLNPTYEPRSQQESSTNPRSPLSVQASVGARTRRAIPS